jgi:hypothetical protein
MALIDLWIVHYLNYLLVFLFLRCYIYIYIYIYIYMGVPHGHSRLFDFPTVEITAHKQIISEKK